ncbi:MAG: type IV pilus twitching motility protein PilT [Candidatus Obscuribacterales bacterium]|nr:type IV pilus twitching motility protein PilT [Candidatus Obscuribacterales bacterium]
MNIELQELMQLVLDRAASDLHIKAGQPPIIRVSGRLERTCLPTLSTKDVEELIFSIINSEQKEKLANIYEVDFSFGVAGLGRFRANIYRDRGSLAAAFRIVSTTIPGLAELGLPELCQALTDKPRGLILVTGPTGSGKSTTLASMIDYINETRSHHILTVEDPIEYLHYDKMSVISQRELGSDTRSFANALRAALREDPDVILVGEMRDLDTIHLALTAAETGHLVLSTVHTSSAAQTVDRIIDAFPHDQQQQIRIMLSNSLVAVISQTLIPRQEELAGGSPITKGRILAAEVLVNTAAVANLIREAKNSQLYATMQMGSKQGMQTLEQALTNLAKAGVITVDDAYSKTTRPDDLKVLLNPERGQPAQTLSQDPPPERRSMFGRLQT